jgi:HK97 family phage portal protein
MRNKEKTINPEESREIQGRLSAAMRSRRPLVFGNDWDFTALQVNPEESQFIETMRLNATQIASIFGVPAEMVGGDQGGPLSYSSPEQNMIHLVSVTLRPWLVRLETAFALLLPTRDFVKFNVDAMIRTSLLERYTAHGMALDQGWRSRDEIRAIEDLPPLPNGEGQAYGLPSPEAPPNSSAE